MRPHLLGGVAFWMTGARDAVVVVLATPCPAEVNQTVNLTAEVYGGTPSGAYTWEYRDDGGAWTPLGGTTSTNSRTAPDGFRHTEYRVSVNVTPDNPAFAPGVRQSAPTLCAINPGKPQDVIASIGEPGGASFTLQLTPVAPATGVTDNYRYTYQVDGGAPVVVEQATQLVIPGLGLGQVVDYQVQATNTSGGVGAPTDPAQSTMPDGVPVGLKATPSWESNVLRWTDPAGLTFDNIIILENGVQVGTALPGAQTFTHSGLTNGQQYSYTLLSRGQHGDSAATDPPVTSTAGDLSGIATTLYRSRADGQSRSARRTIDTANECFEHPDDPAFRMGGRLNWSMAGWVYPRSTSSGFPWFWANDDEQLDQSSYGVQYHRDAGVLQGMFSPDGEARFFTNTIACSQNAWHSVILVFNGTEGFGNIYVDGVESGHVELPGGVADFDNAFTLCCRSWNGGRASFSNIDIKDFNVWHDYAFTDAAAIAFHNGGTPLDDYTGVGIPLATMRYRMDEASGSARNEYGTSLHLTAVNGPETIDAPAGAGWQHQAIWNAQMIEASATGSRATAAGPLTQATFANRPIRSPQDGEMNQQNALLYPSTPSVVMTTTGAPTTGQPFTVFAVFKQAATNQDIIFFSKTGAAGPYLRADSGGNNYVLDGGGLKLQGGTQDTNANILCGVFGGANSGLYFNDTTLAEGDAGTGHIDTTMDVGPNIGKHGEVLIYDGALDADQRAAAFAILKGLYGTA